MVLNRVLNILLFGLGVQGTYGSTLLRLLLNWNMVLLLSGRLVSFHGGISGRCPTTANVNVKDW